MPFAWKITLDNGVSYHFEECVETIRDARSYSQGYGGSCSPFGPNQVTSRMWLLTEIITPNERSINFNYSRTPEKFNLTALGQTWHYRYLDNYMESPITAIQFSQYNRVDHPSCAPYPRYYNQESLETHWRLFNSWTFTRQQDAYLDSINFSGGTVIFNKNNERLDKNGKKLSSIDIINSNRTTIKSIDFFYSYFEGISQGNTYDVQIDDLPETFLTHRLKLDSIRELGKPAYSFVYWEVNLPKKNSFAVDYWGYYNGEINNNSLIPNISRFKGYREEVPLNNGNNHSAKLSCTQASILRQIVYPTGGRTLFEYELNAYPNTYPQKGYFPDFNDTENSITHGNGLRIRQILNYADGYNSYTEKSFEYSGGKNLSKTKPFAEYNFSILRLNCANPPISYWNTGGRYFFNCWLSNNNNLKTSSLFGSGDIVGYDVVTIRDRFLAEYNGKQEIHYVNYPDITPFNYRDYVTPPSYRNKEEPRNGSIIREVFYNENNNIIKTIDREYDFYRSEIFYGFRTAFYKLLIWESTSNVLRLKQQHIGAYYPIYSGQTRPSEIITTDYKDGEPVVTTTTKEYYTNTVRSDLLLKKETTETGDNRLQKTYLYPEQVNTPYRSELFDQNRISTPIKVEKLRNNQGVYSDIIEFKPYDGLLQLRKYIFKKGPGSTPDPYIEFDDYDDKGNVLQYKMRSEPTKSVIWSYKQTCVVVEASNVDYPTLSAAVAASIPSGYANIHELVADMHDIADNAIKQNAWKEFNTALRAQQSMKNAMIQTYTHKPLVGITSGTDPKNRITFYTYDMAGRLQSIMDEELKQQKHLEYHYKNQ